MVIIGNGIAGITAARHIRKNSDFEITVISAESKYFWSRTALMYIYMGHMKYEHTKPYEDWFWEKNRINLLQAYVEKIDTDNKKIFTAEDELVSYDILILATGSKSNKFNWPGENLKGVTGMVSLQDLEQIEKYTNNIERGVVVGGGLLGIELTEMLHSRKVPVSLLVREEVFWGNVLPKQEAAMIGSHIKQHHIDLKLKTELQEIVSDDNGRVCAIITSDGEKIPCQFVGLTAGVHPNIDLASSTAIETSAGILVDEFLETSIPDVYAIGDCVEHRNPLSGRSPIEQVWYTGRMMGETVAQTICNTRTAFKPGPWFNSAKFLDIEYQTYGSVSNTLNRDEEEFYWEHESGKVAIHFVFHKEDHKFLGVNSFGLRLKHECFDRWLKDQKDIQYVMEHLSEANFDPEFADRHEATIINVYNQQFPDLQVTAKQRRKKVFGIF